MLMMIPNDVRDYECEYEWEYECYYYYYHYYYFVVVEDFMCRKEKKAYKAICRHHFPIYCILEYCATRAHMLAII